MHNYTTSKYQRGLTLVELFISMTLGLLVLLTAIGLVVSSKSLFLAQTDGAETQDTSRFAIDNISRALRQTGFINFSSDIAVQITPSTAGADLAGLDQNSVSATSTDISTPLNQSVNNSDLLAVRFFGSGTTGSGDSSVTNCAGFSVPEPTSIATADQDRGWSIYYVALDDNSEPELVCKYYDSTGGGNWTAQSIVKGVESFQVLYGLDTSPLFDGLANKFLTATDINALDNAIVLTATTAAGKIAEKNQKTFWKRITEVKIAMLVRGKENARTDDGTTKYNLFGDTYATANGTKDLGTTIFESTLPAATKGRVRKIYNATVLLRNVCQVDAVGNKCLPPN